MRVGKLSFLPLLLSSLCLVSYAQDTPKPYAALNGIWHIAGSRAPSEYPGMTLSLAVDGDTIYGDGHLDVRCSNIDDNSGIGFYVAGKVADDGTFLLTSNDTSSSPQATHVAIRGSVPSAGSETWEGSFTAMNGTAPTIADPPTVCMFDASEDFVASALPSMSGTWAGSVHSPSLGTDLIVSVELKQEAVAPDEPSQEVPFLSAPDYYIPLSATITVGGDRIFTTDKAIMGRERNSGTDRVHADSFILTFPMDDGSILLVSGNYTDESGSALNVSCSKWVDAQPTSEGSGGTLIRQ